MEIRPRICERARQLVSLELDGELSVFERRMLKRHLQRCKPCTAYAHDVTGHTRMLRAAPLEQIRLDVSFQRRRTLRVLPSIAATAAVAAVGIWFGFSSMGSARVPTNSGTFSHGSGVAVGAASDDRYDWPAGLPRTVQFVELGPGSLYTGNA